MPVGIQISAKHKLLRSLLEYAILWPYYMELRLDDPVAHYDFKI